jgi:hypothetical protein
MAGKVQHEIPRLYLRGFLIPDENGAERVFVFRRGGTFFASSIERAAAEKYFYSRPSNNKDETLDDRITQYEARRLGSLVRQLRGARVGSIVDAGVAAEITAHLTTRNAHLRGTFAHGVTRLVTTASRVLSEEESFRRFLGLDRPVPSDVLRRALAEAIESEPKFAALGVPSALLERAAFTLARENFPEFSGTEGRMLRAVLAELSAEASEIARRGHTKGLEKTIVPESRAKNLGTLQWQVVATKSDIILPDCVALAINASAQPVPLMMAASGDIDAVVLPLTSRTALLARQNESCGYDIEGFNSAAASCSYYYFVSPSCAPDIRALQDLIGTRSVLAIDSAVGESFEPHLLGPGEVRGPLEARKAGRGQTVLRTVPVSFLGTFDQDERKRISEVVSDVLVESAWTVPLDRIEGITFADDYPAALSSVDPGIPGCAPPATREDEGLRGIAKCPTVLRDGVVQSHIVIHGDIGRALLSDDTEQQSFAVSVLANQLAQAGVTQVIDEALPGVLLSSAHDTDALAAVLHPCTYPAWNAYFASRGAPFLPEAQLKNNQEVLLIAIQQAFVAIPRARLAYRTHGSIDGLLSAALPQITSVLEVAARVLGSADGLGREPLYDAAELETELRQRELHAWLTDFRRDLSYLWDRRGAWEGYGEFLALNRHAERLLWPFSIFLWLTADGQCWVEVPINADAAALRKE